MPSTVFDSAIFRDAFGSPAMREVFSDSAAVARYVEVEVALAAVEGQARRHPQGGRRRHRQARRRRRPSTWPRSRTKTDVVGYPIVGLVQPARQAVRRCRPLPALGRHHPGHHGHRAWCCRCARPWRSSRPTSRASTRRWPRWPRKHRDDRDGRPHASAARPARDVRLQGGRLAQHDPAAPPAPDRTEAARAGRPVRGRGRHAGLARRQGPRRARRADGRTWARPPADRLARRPATALPRRSPSSASSPARWPRSPPTSCC